MSELQTILVIAPPLLADLIRSVVSARFEQFDDSLSIVTESDNLDALRKSLFKVNPDVVIIGPTTDLQLIASLFPPLTPVLTLSSNLRIISGPGWTDIAVFTPESLAGRVRDALRYLADRDGDTLQA